MVNKIINEYGDIHYYNEQNQLHREDGPAEEWSSGSKFWFINGQKHRLDGPAEEYHNGDILWYNNNLLHRIDGPAVDCLDEDKVYYIMGKALSYEEWLAIKDYPLLW